MKTEKDIIRKIQKGDENAVKEIFEEYYDGLCLYAESIVKNHQIAEEIVEDLFIYLWLNASTISIRISIKNYLYRSTLNNCMKYLSKLKTEKKRVEQLHYTLVDNEILNPASIFQPISNLIVKELEAKAEHILNSLPEHCRKIYSLNRHHNLSYAEIASKLNISVSTVKTQMSRAFKRFHEGLKDFIS